MRVRIFSESLLVKFWEKFRDWDLSVKRLGVAAAVVLLGLLAAASIHSRFRVTCATWPVYTFLFNPSFRYSDLTDTLANAHQGDPYFETADKISVYFPFTYWALGFVRNYPDSKSISWFWWLTIGAYVCLSFWGPLLIFGVGRKALCVAMFFSVVIFCSYPLLFSLDRGNLDSLIGATCFLSLLLLYVDRSVPAAAFLAIAIAVKGYPLMLIFLFAKRGRMKAGLLAALGAVLLNVLALHCLAGGLGHNWNGFCANMRKFQERYVQGCGAMHYCADPYDGLRIAAYGLRQRWPAFVLWFLGWLLDLYPIFSASVLLACSAYVLFSSAAFHRRLLSATLAMILYPWVASDYKLVLLLPLVFFMAVDERPWSKADTVAFAILELLLVSKNYYFLYADVSISCLISPVLLLMLLTTLALDGLAWKHVSNAIRFGIRHPRMVWTRLSCGPSLEVPNVNKKTGARWRS